MRPVVSRVGVRAPTSGIFKFAHHYFCRDLEKQGRRYIRHHFKQILQESAEFKDLLCDELEAILRDDELNVKSEEIVFDAVKTWVERRIEERRVYLPRLLECIRYGLMSHKYFVNNIVNWKLVEESEVSTRFFTIDLHTLCSISIRIMAGLKYGLSRNNLFYKRNIPFWLSKKKKKKKIIAACIIFESIIFL